MILLFKCYEVGEKSVTDRIKREKFEKSITQQRQIRKSEELPNYAPPRDAHFQWIVSQQCLLDKIVDPLETSPQEPLRSSSTPSFYKNAHQINGSCAPAQPPSFSLQSLCLCINTHFLKEKLRMSGSTWRLRAQVGESHVGRKLNKNKKTNWKVQLPFRIVLLARNRRDPLRLRGVSAHRMPVSRHQHCHVGIGSGAHVQM